MIIEEAYYYHFLSSCFYAISRRLFLCKLCLQFTRKSRWKLLLRSRVKKSMFFLENISQISLRKEVRLSGRSETCCVAHIFDFRSEVFFWNKYPSTHYFLVRPIISSTLSLEKYILSFETACVTSVRLLPRGASGRA